MLVLSQPCVRSSSQFIRTHKRTHTRFSQCWQTNKMALLWSSLCYSKRPQMTEADESVRTAKLIQQEVQQSWHRHSQILTHFAPEHNHSILHAMRRNRLFHESRTATRLIYQVTWCGNYKVPWLQWHSLAQCPHLTSCLEKAGKCLSLSNSSRLCLGANEPLRSVTIHAQFNYPPSLYTKTLCVSTHTK